VKASQLAKIEALKMRAEANKAYYSDLENRITLYGELNVLAEQMSVLALEFEQEERAEAGK
jgi:hypothetical protein